MNLYINNQYQKALKSFDQIHKDTSFIIKDGKEQTIIHSFLYKNGDDIHLDYYRNFEVNFPYKINMCQSMLNYYHSVDFNSEKSLNEALHVFQQISEKENAVSMITGITPYDDILLKSLEKNHFTIKRCSTAMVKELHSSDINDITLALPRKKRNKLRNIRKKFSNKNVTLSREPISSEEMNDLLDITLKEKDPSRLLTPKKYVEDLIQYLNPDFFLAKIENKVIGSLIAKRINDDYYILFSAHLGKESLDMYNQSYLLFENAISYAAQLGCKKVHGGRDPYIFKRNFNFTPVPIYWAAYSSSESQQINNNIWLESLSMRHQDKYGGKGI